MLIASGVPGVDNAGGIRRGVKIPGSPVVAVIPAETSLNQRRIGPLGMSAGACKRDETRSQNRCSLSIRASGGLPAISAALIAPIEMPAIQSGDQPAAASAS